MASEKVIAANRANAQKSTGPRSAEGKAKSRLNAVRDGLTGQIITLSDEDRALFEKLRADFLADYKPANTVETKLIAAIAWDNWRLDRLRATEENIFAMGIDAAELEADAEDPGITLDDRDIAFAGARTFLAESSRLDIMSLYEQRMTRSLHRNLDKLRSLQNERKRLYQEDLLAEVILARYNEVAQIPIVAPKRPSKNGFVFSDAEIALAAVRQRHIESAINYLDHTPVSIKYGDMMRGLEDTYLLPYECQRTISQMTRDAYHGVPLETLVQRRQDDPDKYNPVRQ